MYVKNTVELAVAFKTVFFTYSLTTTRVSQILCNTTQPEPQYLQFATSKTLPHVKERAAGHRHREGIVFTRSTRVYTATTRSKLRAHRSDIGRRRRRGGGERRRQRDGMDPRKWRIDLIFRASESRRGG